MRGPTTSRAVAHIVRTSGAAEGLATVFIHHSASAIITENAIRSRADLERFAAKLVPMAIACSSTMTRALTTCRRTSYVLTQTSIGIPIAAGALAFGTWQGCIYGAPHGAASAQGDGDRDR